MSVSGSRRAALQPPGADAENGRPNSDGAAIAKRGRAGAGRRNSGAQSPAAATVSRLSP